MTRKIKAQDVKPGMEIEWKRGGYYIRCVVGLVEKEDLSYPAFSIRAVGSSAGWKVFSEGDEVTVLKEPQPPEPTTFGAAVEVDGVKYVRASQSSQACWVDEYDQWNRWETLCRRGTVEVKPYPFATPAQTEPEPRVWEQWEDVPELTPVRVGDAFTPYRKVDGSIERKPGEVWAPAFVDEYDLNKYSPFTESRDA